MKEDLQASISSRDATQDEADEVFYSFDEVKPGMTEIQGYFSNCDSRRAWAYRNGFTAIGFYTVNFTWYAYN